MPSNVGVGVGVGVVDNNITDEDESVNCIGGMSRIDGAVSSSSWVLLLPATSLVSMRLLENSFHVMRFSFNILCRTVVRTDPEKKAL
jgi:hypothetical protein